MAQRLHIQVVDSDSQFVRLEREWDALLLASGEHSHFMRWHWQALWFKHLAPRGSRLHVLVFRDALRNLVGIAPLYRRPRRLCGIPVSHSLCLLGTGAAILISEHVGLLAQQGQESELAAALAEYLSRGGRWHRLWLWNVPEASAWLSALRAQLNCRVTVCDRSYYVRTDAPWRQVQSPWTRNFRYQVDRSLRLLKDRQNCRFSQVTSQQQLQRLWPEFVRLHQLRWNRKGQPGSFSNDAFADFLYSAMQRALADNQLRFWYCQAGDKVVATLVAFVSRGTAHYFQGGFDPDFSKLSVGTAMIAHSIQSCIDDNTILEFDFMGGGANYKSSWTPLTRTAMQVEYFPASWIGKTYALGRDLRAQVGQIKRAGLRLVARATLRTNVCIVSSMLVAGCSFTARSDPPPVYRVAAAKTVCARPHIVSMTSGDVASQPEPHW